MIAPRPRDQGCDPMSFFTVTIAFDDLFDGGTLAAG
jgi:hypothetical protein